MGQSFTNGHLGGQGMLEYVCVSVLGFIQGFEFWEGEIPKFGIDVEGLYST